MREWLSWWSTTLPRSGPRVRVPSRALVNTKEDIPMGYPFFVLPELSRTLEGSSVSASLRSAQSRRPPDVVRRLAPCAAGPQTGLRSQHPGGCFGRFGWKKVHRTFFLFTLTVSRSALRRPVFCHYYNIYDNNVYAIMGSKWSFLHIIWELDWRINFEKAYIEVYSFVIYCDVILLHQFANGSSRFDV